MHLEISVQISNSALRVSDDLGPTSTPATLLTYKRRSRRMVVSIQVESEWAPTLIQLGWRSRLIGRNPGDRKTPPRVDLSSPILCPAIRPTTVRQRLLGVRIAHPKPFNCNCYGGNLGFSREHLVGSDLSPHQQRPQGG